jgi:hypothetical protein
MRSVETEAEHRHSLYDVSAQAQAALSRDGLIML